MSILSRFKSDAQGNIMVMMGLSALPIVIAMGFAVDYSRASSARISMQAAVDAAALAAAHNASSMSPEELTAYARDYFNANFSGESVTVEDFTARIEGKAVIAEGKGTMPSSLLVLAGFETLPVVAEAKVGWQSNKIEVALVLDNSNSMSGSPIKELRKAATNFVNTLEKERKSEDSIRVSLVSFNDKVRVDADAYRNAAWLRMDGISKSSWTGCLTERDMPYNIRTTEAQSNSSKYPAVKCGNSENIAPIVRLTDDMDALRAGIAKMVENANTNLTMAATWGAMTLSDSGVFADGAASGDAQKFMVLFTDGNNTDSRHHGFNAKHNTAMDPDTRAMCKAAKDSGVVIYTMRLGKTSDASVLQDCSSGPNMFVDVSSASQLDAAFQGIIEDMSRLRLTN